MPYSGLNCTYHSNIFQKYFSTPYIFSEPSLVSSRSLNEDTYQYDDSYDSGAAAETSRSGDLTFFGQGIGRPTPNCICRCDCCPCCPCQETQPGVPDLIYVDK